MQWLVPFGHHPAWCAGPHHTGMVEQLDGLIPLYERAGVWLMLAGHEHNFQHGRHRALHHVVTGAAPARHPAAHAMGRSARRRVGRRAALRACRGSPRPPDRDALWPAGSRRRTGATARRGI